MIKNAAVAVLLLGSLSTAAAGAAAQDVIVGFDPPPAAMALEWYRHPITTDAHRNGASVVTHVFRRHQEFPRTYVDSLIAGLETMALQDTSGAVRMSAAGDLAHLASDHYGMTPMPGAMQRIRRIYRQTTDPLVRSLIVSSLPTVADRTAAVAWLRQIARQGPGTEEFPDAAHNAIGALRLLGDEGRAALRELYRDRADLPDPEARAGLEILARENFPVVDARERNRAYMRERSPHH